MTSTEFRKINAILKKAYSELGIDIPLNEVNLLSQEYQEVINKVKTAILEKYSFSEEEYDNLQEKISATSKEGIFAIIEKTKEKIKELENRHIPTIDEIEEVADRIAQKYIVEPKITNQIVKETIVEKPIYKTETIIEREEYNDNPLRAEIGFIENKLENRINEIPILDIESLRSEFDENLKHNIDTLGMPDFRKLAMGLRADIDRLSASPAGSSAWGSITGTLSNQTDLQTALDAKLDGNGVATYVPFYSDANTLTSEAHFNYDSASHRLHVHALAGDATDGLLIESDNGTDIGILGAANTANVTWYGNHNFNTATQDTIAGFTGAGKTLGSLALATYPSLTELSYVKGVTSAIQTQLNGKGDVVADDTSTTAQNIVAYSGTGGKNITELTGTQGDVLYHNGTSWAKLGAGTVGQYLETGGSGANPSWNYGAVVHVSTSSGATTTGANTNPVSVSGAVFTYVNNAIYRIWVMGRVNSTAATTGIGIQFDVSTAITSIDVQFFHQLASTGTLTGGHSIADAASVGVSSGVPAGPIDVPFTAFGLFIPGNNTGTCQLQLRAEVAAVTELLAGTTMVVERIA